MGFVWVFAKALELIGQALGLYIKLDVIGIKFALMRTNHALLCLPPAALECNYEDSSSAH